MFGLGWLVDGYRSAIRDRDRPAADSDRYVDVATSLDRACFDLVLLADANDVLDRPTDDEPPPADPSLGDPVPLAARMLCATEQIVVLPTLGTAEWEAEPLALATAALAEQSEGRSGWSAVTGRARYAFDADPPTPAVSPVVAERHHIARGYADTVDGIWDQRAAVRPLTAWAGDSDTGRDLVARHADVIVACAPTVADMREYRDDVRLRMARHGRDPDRSRVYFLVRPIVEAMPTAPAADGAPVEPPSVTGTATAVADRLIDMMVAIGGDGFLLAVDDALSYRNVAAITEGLVPELQRLGALRSHTVNPLTVER